MAYRDPVLLNRLADLVDGRAMVAKRYLKPWNAEAAIKQCPPVAPRVFRNGRDNVAPSSVRSYSDPIEVALPLHLLQPFEQMLHSGPIQTMSQQHEFFA